MGYLCSFGATLGTCSAVSVLLLSCIVPPPRTAAESAGSELMLGKIAMSCLMVSKCVGWSGHSGELRQSVDKAFSMSCRHAAMMSTELAPGMGIFSGNHTTVSDVRSPWVVGIQTR